MYGHSGRAALNTQETHVIVENIILHKYMKHFYIIFYTSI